MTNVLLVTQRFYPPWSDGTVSYARGLVDAISETNKLEKNLEITVLSLTDKIWFPKLHRKEMETYVKKRNINVEWFASHDKGHRLNLRKLSRKLMRTSHYEVVHIVCAGLHPVFIRLGIKNNVRQSTLVKHLFIYPYHKSFATEKIAYNLLYKTSIFQKLKIDFAFSSKVLQETYGIDRATILPPAIDTKFYMPKRRRTSDSWQFLAKSKTKLGSLENVLQRDARVLYMGPLLSERFDWKKVVGGFAKLCRNYGINAGLAIVGRGFEEVPYLENLRRFINKKELSNRIFLCLKDLSETEKLCLFRHTHVFIYPFFERPHYMSVVFPPIALLESMSAGLCVVTGGLPHLDSLIKNYENGILLEGKIDDKIFAEGMWAALSSKRKLSQNARSTIKRDFSIKHVSELYNNFLLKIGI